jgi:hypothetical protein
MRAIIFTDSYSALITKLAMNLTLRIWIKLIFKKDSKDLDIRADNNVVVNLIKEFELDAMVRTEQMFPTGVVIQ